MKHKFSRIFNLNNKRNGAVPFATVILLITVAGLLASCTNINGSFSFLPGSVSTSVSTPKPSDDLFIVPIADNSYTMDRAGNITFRYRNGAVTVKAPLTLDVTGSVPGMSFSETGFYLSEEKTAIVYGFADGKSSPLHVTISNDMGKTWNEYTIEGAKGYDTKFIGFSSEKEGWIISGGSAGVGQSMNYIYQTSDGGQTWQEIGNANEQYAEQLTGAGFYNKNIGFLGFRYYEDKGPVIYLTKDRGQTWEKLSIALPEQFDEYEKTPLSPVFNGMEGRLPIWISKNGNEAQTIYLTSKDGGLSWVYEQ
ncbi:WD40/YVTN/BNR-like repeat-containing protein [Paenibacillus radicis (ex Gao et al. 2016)]|uniref:Exo-alpha-sialidase n=1 Tax=Paenibacillus radicis (ex Gao et al. 2016) TaxID=1737354 RepID=A0A917HQ64_9BACL|nr:hypothetical protein [Paenibacillus radicis (ex Gao et al. 2016)]GGG85942.1 hypothetical protein GCM10010918_50040 [Paenibacillus radicis (ex Gao et al. 2016)]